MVAADFTALAANMTGQITLAIAGGLVVWGAIAGIGAAKNIFGKLAGK